MSDHDAKQNENIDRLIERCAGIECMLSLAMAMHFSLAPNPIPMVNQVRDGVRKQLEGAVPLHPLKDGAQSDMFTANVAGHVERLFERVIQRLGEFQ